MLRSMKRNDNEYKKRIDSLYDEENALKNTEKTVDASPSDMTGEEAQICTSLEIIGSSAAETTVEIITDNNSNTFNDRASSFDGPLQL